MKFPEGIDSNSPVVLHKLLTTPIQTTISTLQNMIQDIGFMLISSWFNTFQPSHFTLRLDFSAIVWIMVLIVTSGLVYYLTRESPTPPGTSELDKRWTSQAMILGIAIIVLGVLPIWLMEKQAQVGLYANRFALAAMPGLALTWVAALEWVITRRLPRAIVLSVIIGLAVGFHLQTANEFRHIWEKQRSFYWQLFWRAPTLKSPTLVLSDGEFLPFVGEYSTSAGINLLYSDGRDTRRLNYWFVDLQNAFAHGITRWYESDNYTAINRALNFTGSRSDNIVIVFSPENGECLRVLNPSDAQDLLLSENTREALQFTNLGRIDAQQPEGNLPPRSIFGPEPDRNWCYYFEKAELAAQFSYWNEVLALEKQAKQAGASPNNTRELLPFIKAHAWLGDWDKAHDLTIKTFQTNTKLKRLLCSTWDELSKKVPSSSINQQAINDINNRLKCLVEDGQVGG